MKKLLDICLHLLIIATVLFVISFVPDKVAWLRQSLFLIGGVIAFMDLIMLLIGDESRATPRAAKMLTYLGFFFLASFVVWIFSFFMTSLNFLFSLLGSDFRLEEIYQGTCKVIFSIPALISGVLLYAIGRIWQSDYWEEKHNKGKPTRAFR